MQPAQFLDWAKSKQLDIPAGLEVPPSPAAVIGDQAPRPKAEASAADKERRVARVEELYIRLRDGGCIKPHEVGLREQVALLVIDRKKIVSRGGQEIVADFEQRYGATLWADDGPGKESPCSFAGWSLSATRREVAKIFAKGNRRER